MDLECKLFVQSLVFIFQEKLLKMWAKFDKTHSCWLKFEIVFEFMAFVLSHPKDKN